MIRISQGRWATPICRAGIGLRAIVKATNVTISHVGRRDSGVLHLSTLNRLSRGGIPPSAILATSFPTLRMTRNQSSSINMDVDPSLMVTLLTLHPHENDNAPIRCETWPVDLNENPEYEALSYAWGDTTAPSEAIEVNGQKLQVGRNLYLALKRIRKPDTPRVLWIDQLCIDQTNVAEKTRQVQLMQHIYSGCSTCLAWMGEIPDDVAVRDAKWLFDAFEYLAVYYSSRGNGDIPIPDILAERADFDGPHKALEALMGAGNSGLETSSWWKRIWTVQEAILPPKLLLILGPLSIPWKKLSNAMLCLHERPIPPRLRSFLHSQCYNLLWDLMANCVSLRQAKPRLVAPLETFFTWRIRDATDPRDKVYALLGLINRGALLMTGKCDYGLSVGRVFSNLTVDLILQEECLMPLVSGLRLEATRPIIPGWTFNLSHRGDYGTDWHSFYGYDYYAACAFRTLNCESFKTRMDREPDVLQIPGSYADKVALVGEPMILNKHSALISDSDYRSCIKSWNILGKKSYPQRFTFWEDFGRALIGDLVRYNDAVVERRATTRDVHMVYEFLAGHNMEEDEGQKGLKYTIRKTISNQTFFLSEKGMLGLGPLDTKTGDEIWVLDGGNVPFILRPRHQDLSSAIEKRNKPAEDHAREGATNGKNVSEYRFHDDDQGESRLEELDFDFGGTCYVHGIMTGQLIIGTDCEPPKKMLRMH